MGTGGRISDAEFAALVTTARERHNLSDIVGRYTQLRKRGRELVGLCCFHTERTPSLEVNDAKGYFHCKGCGAGGDAITFLVKRLGLSFTDALRELLGDDLPVVSPEERAQRRAEDEALKRRRIEYGRSLWSRAAPAAGTLAEVYALARGITQPLPPSIRFCACPRFVNHDTGETGRDFPAVIAALQDRDGAITGVQAIFLSPDGAGKYQSNANGAAKLTFGALVGSALRLGPIADHVVLCEGPEDGLTLRQQLDGPSVWASCGTANLEQVKFPKAVRSVCLAGDNGRAGRVAVDRARDAHLTAGLKVSETYPDSRFKDWNDQLREIAA